MNSTEIFFNESRSNLRVREKAHISWRTPDNGFKGRCRVHNISVTGMLIETDKILDQRNHRILDFDLPKDTDFIPKRGRIVWQKKKGLVRKNSLCGVEFIHLNENILSKLRQRIQKAIIHFTRMRRVKSTLDVSLFVVIMGLMAYVIWLASGIYENTSTANQTMLDLTDKQANLTRNYSRLYNESEKMLKGVSADLETTKTLLAQTETMLTQTKSELGEMKSVNETLRSEFAASKQRLEDTVASLEQRSQELNTEMQDLKGKIAFYEGNISDLREGRDLLNLYRSKMKLVKSKIRVFKAEAQEVRQSAQKERDRIQSIIGNNGYFVRNGETVTVDMDQYKAAETEPAVDSKNVQIDVTFFE